MINILAKTALAIMAVVVLVTMVNGIGQNNQVIIDMAYSMFKGVLFTIVIVTGIINLPRLL